MSEEFINLTLENIDEQHLCCIIRLKTAHPGVESKRAWLKERIPEGHVFRKLDEKGCVFIEYAPLESAWVPITGDNYLYIYCLWVDGAFKGKGYGKQLMDYCIQDARAKGKSGICMLGAQKQKSWLSDQGFAQRFGFQVVDESVDGYQLLALSFDGSLPKFNSYKHEIDSTKLTIYYSAQCPFIIQKIQDIEKYCIEKKIDADLIEVKDAQQAKALPCAFNNWALFYQGKFETVNLMDWRMVEKLVQKKK